MSDYLAVPRARLTGALFLTHTRGHAALASDCAWHFLHHVARDPLSSAAAPSTGAAAPARA